jgi:hypothetical protein
MKRNLALASFAFAAAAAACSSAVRADDITVDTQTFVPSASRAEVRAELDAFRKSGINPWARNYDPLRNFRSAKTRAEVTAEYIRERESVSAMNGEDSGSQYLAGIRDAAATPVRMAGRRSRDKAQQ